MERRTAFPGDHLKYTAPKQKGLLPWWYRIAARSEVSITASLAEREAVRRSQLASIILLFALILVLPGIPSATNNPILGITLAIVIIVILLSFVLNRLGHTSYAGILAVCAMEVGITTSIILSPSPGFGQSNLPMFDLLVQAELVAVSILPEWSVFPVAIVNSFFVVIRLNLIAGITKDLHTLLLTDASRIISTPIILQVMVAIVTFLWVRSSKEAIQRADRAEVIEELQKSELNAQAQLLEQKENLDRGIKQILEAHNKFANGNLQARAPLERENVLWQLASAYNTLLQRVQRSLNAEQQLAILQRQSLAIADSLQKAREEGKPIQLSRLGTPLDAIVNEIIISSRKFPQSSHHNDHENQGQSSPSNPEKRTQSTFQPFSSRNERPL